MAEKVVFTGKIFICRNKVKKFDKPLHFTAFKSSLDRSVVYRYRTQVTIAGIDYRSQYSATVNKQH